MEHGLANIQCSKIIQLISYFMLFTVVHPYPKLVEWYPPHNYTRAELKSLEGKDLKFTCNYYATSDSSVFHVIWKINNIIQMKSYKYEIIHKAELDEDDVVGENISVTSLFIIHNFTIADLLLEETEITCEAGYNIKLIYNLITPSLTGIHLFVIHNNISAEKQGEY